MPKLVNRNPHPIRPKGPDGNLVRIVSGQVVDADGDYADALSQTSGVESASSDEVKAWDAKLDAARTGGAMPGDGSRLSSKLAISPALLAARMAATVAPLQRVVGDDAAPQGPPSGTITTRGQAATSGDDRDLKAFAQGEELVMQGEKVEAPGASELDVLAGRATQSDIHNAQVDNADAAEAVAKAVIEGDAPKTSASRRAKPKAAKPKADKDKDGTA